MSIQIPKIIEIYQQTHQILSAKNQLFIQDTSSTSTPMPEPTQRTSTKSGYQICAVYVLKSYRSVLRNWMKKFTIFSILVGLNYGNLEELEARMQGLRSNTSYLTKQQQLLTQIESTLKQWQQIKDPLLYYDLKKRETLKTDLSQKLSQLKQNLINTKQSTTPMSLRKLQQQLKYTTYIIYKNQLEIDENMRRISIKEYEKIVELICVEDRELRGGGGTGGRDGGGRSGGTGSSWGGKGFYNYVGEEKEEFVGRYAGVFSKGVRIGEAVFFRYNQQLSQLAKNFSKYWQQHVQILDDILSTTKTSLTNLHQNKQTLQIRQTKIFQLLQTPCQTLHKIYNTEYSLIALNLLTKQFDIIPMFRIRKFQEGVRNVRLQVLENGKDMEDYWRKVVKEIRDREKEFYLYGMDDKKFLDCCAKSQVVIRKRINQCYAKFLSQLYELSKQSLKLFKKQPPQILQQHQINSLLTRQLLSQAPQSQSLSIPQQQPNSFSQSPSTNASTFSKNKSNKKIFNKKLGEIQAAIQKIQVFDSSGINWDRNNVFSCALGPRLLLHGKIVVMEEGLYFQSMFNKKNLFFGRTRLYIPKPQILQIDTQNTLLIFPDAIQLKTPVGPIYFHSLSQRLTISTTLNQIYFPQNAANQQNQIQEQFNQYREGQYEKIGEKEIEGYLRNLENVNVERVWTGISLPRFFRRYFGDDKFEIRGNVYQNFKTYFLLQIQAIDPKSTPITPQPPPYFTYKKQHQQPKNDPKISQRYHTYKKLMPKIPFLSSGGEGLCEDKQIYHWISPKILVMDAVSKVKGFSLVENMEIHTRTICQEVGNGVKFRLSNTVKFTSDSSTNSLVKGPAISNLKQSMQKMSQIIQKYQKGKKSAKKNKDQGKGTGTRQQNQQLQENIAKLVQENRKLKLRFKIVVGAFVVLYVMTLAFFGVFL